MMLPPPVPYKTMNRSKRKYGSGIVGDAGSPPALSPCDFLPGSDMKMKVMSQRVDARTSLFHPKDAGMPGVEND